MPVAPTADPTAATLTLTGLAKYYAGTDQAAVEDVNLTVLGGEMLALLGPSGCGKTTTLRMISGLVQPSAGSIAVGGRDLTAVPVHRRGMGMVFQSYALFPHMSVSRNVGYGLTTRGVPKAERASRVQEALAMVSLKGYEDRRPSQLSGGQQQRVALARALVVHPSLLLLDEPLSNLDAKLRDEMRDEIRSLQQRLGITTVFVTHDQDEALAAADKIAVMHAGRVQQVGTPADIYENPANEFVARFIGRSNLLEGMVVDRSGPELLVEVRGFGRLRCAAGRCAAGCNAVRVLLRPHRIDLVAAGQSSPATVNTLRGFITDRAYTGDILSVRVRIGEELLRVELPTRGGRDHVPGDAVDVVIGEGAALALPLELSDPTN